MTAARRVTMQDVADRANVSKSAVSLAFNDSSKLSAATLRNILAVAAELGYAQDPAARMLRTRRTNSLGLLLPQQLDKVLENPYYNQFLQGIGHTCQREGYTLLLAPPLRGSMLKSIPYAAVDGFIVSGLEYDRGEVSALRQRGIPFVLVDSEPHEGVASVEIEDSSAMEQLVLHLLGHGHRRIAFLAIETGVEGGYQNWRGPVLRRMQGALAALSAYGLGPDTAGITIHEVACTRSGGVRGFKEVWRGEQRPTAIVAFSDVIAFGVLDAAREMDIAVPEELSVTGFDDLAEARWAGPGLTTVRQPIETKGRLASEYLLEALSAGDHQHDVRHRLEATFLVRGSTGPAPSHAAG